MAGEESLTPEEQRKFLANLKPEEFPDSTPLLPLPDLPAGDGAQQPDSSASASASGASQATSPIGEATSGMTTQEWLQLISNQIEELPQRMIEALQGT